MAEEIRCTFPREIPGCRAAFADRCRFNEAADAPAVQRSPGVNPQTLESGLASMLARPTGTPLLASSGSFSPQSGFVGQKVLRGPCLLSSLFVFVFGAVM